MTRLVGIRLNGIHSGIHRGQQSESPFFRCVKGGQGYVGKQAGPGPSRGQLRRPGHPPWTRPAELCCQRGELFCNSRKRGDYRRKGGVRGSADGG